MHKHLRVAAGVAAVLILANVAGCTSGAQGPTKLKTRVLDLGDGVKLELVRIPAGEFLMGSPPDEPGRLPSEGPQHRVRIAEPFYIGKCEVTQKQWAAVMGAHRSWYPADDQPVERVTWTDCREFCERLSQRLGLPVHLPSEAQWEYACRAGSTGRWSFGDDEAQLGDYAWTCENSDLHPHAVGQKKPNAWGLYDMHGNVWEWCEDGVWPDYEGAPDDGSARAEPASEPTLRVLRGGAWYREVSTCRSAARWSRGRSMSSAYIGFRVVVEAAK